MKNLCHLSLFVSLLGILLASGPTAAYAAAPPKTLKLVYSNKVCYEPFIIAKANGYFAEEGLKVEVKLVSGGILAAESLLTGSADVAAMGDAPFLIAASRSHNVRLLASYGGGSKMHRVIARRNITDIQQLEGARVGIQMGSSTYGAFLAWCRQVGLEPGKIHFVSLSPLDMPQAMQTGQLDAMAGSEPWPSNVEATAGDQVHELTDFSALHNSFPLLVAASATALEQRRDEMDALLRALSKAIRFMEQQPEQTVKILAAAIGLPEPQQRRCTYQLNWGIGFTKQDQDSLHMTANYLKDLGKIDRIPAISAVMQTASAPQ